MEKLVNQFDMAAESEMIISQIKNGLRRYHRKICLKDVFVAVSVRL